MTNVFARWIAAAIATLLVVASGTAVAQQVSDESAPVVSGGTLSPVTVDTNSGAVNVTATVQATDDLSGVNYVYLYLRTLANNQAPNSTSISCYVGSLQSGSRTSGTFTGTCQFPQYSQSGTWFVYQVYAYDMVGNYRSYYNSGAALTSFPQTIAVTAPNPPTAATGFARFVSISTSPGAVDASSAPVTITVEARITSPNGLQSASANFYDPAGMQGFGVWFSSYNRVSGTAQDGVYRGTLTLPRYARSGAWVWRSAYAYDATNPYLGYQWNANGSFAYAFSSTGTVAGEGAPMLSPGSVQVTSSPSDTTAPSLIDFALSPTSIDVAGGPATVAITMDATDDLSGFNYGCVVFVSPNGQQYRSGCFWAGQSTSTIFFPQFSQAGNWNLYYLYLYDRNNNYRFYYTAELAGLGFPVNIQISTGLSVANASGPVGGTVNLSAKLTRLGQPSPGKTIQFTLRGVPAGSAVTDADGVATLSGVSLGSTPAGNYQNGIVASFAGDATQAAASGAANLNVTNKLDQTITFGTLPDRLLSDPAFNITASASSGLAVSFAAVGGCTVSGSVVTLTAAGECKIVATQPGSAAYNAAPSVSRTFNVSAKSDQTILFGALGNKRYGDAAVTLAATASSQLPVSFEASGPCSISGSSLSITGIGSCTVTARQAGNASFNAAPDVARSFQIARAALTVRAEDKSKTYGAATPAFTWAANGFVNGEGPGVIGGAAEYTTPAGSSGVGAHAIGISGLTAANYDITFVAGTLTVTPASLLVRADSFSKRYGDPLPPLTATAEGLVNGDTLASLGTVAFATTVTAASPVGSYPVTPSGLSAANYTVAYADGSVTVTRAKATVIANDASKPYGAALPPLTSRVEGLVNGDTAMSLMGTVSVTTTATAASAVGTYPVNVGGLSSPNYDLTFQPGTLGVTRVALLVTGQDRSKAYGAPLPAFGAGLSGLVNGDTIGSLAGSLGFNTAATASSPVGSYLVVPTGLSSPNYDIAFVPATLSVTPVGLLITANDATKVYGSALPGFGVSASGLVNGDTLASLSGALGFSTVATVTSPVGSYAVIPGGLSSGNYVIAFAPGTLVITKATLQVRANPATSQYSDPLATLTAAISGLLNGDLPSVVSGQPALSTTATPQSAPGTYPITVAQGTLSAQNYLFEGFHSSAYTLAAEDARAAYTGLLFASTSSVTSGMATVSLSVAIQDITAWVNDALYDPYAGDIRKATVSFVNRNAGDAVLCTASVGLVSAADSRSGVAACSWNADIGASDSMSITLGVVVAGHYDGGTAVDDAIVTISRPLTTQFVTGGGYLTLTHSAGQAAGAAGSKANFGFNVKFDKTGTRLDGSMNLIVRANGRIFQIDATSFESLSVQAGTPGRGAFAAKAIIRDVTDDARPVVIDGEATLQVVMSDYGQPGNKDTLAMTVLNRSGGLWFSSSWSGTGTVEQALGGGNVVVH